MICRENMSNPNQGGGYSVTGGRNDPDPSWCDCRQGECQMQPCPANYTPYGDPDQPDRWGDTQWGDIL